MDSFRDYPTDFDLPAAGAVAQPYDVAAAIGTDERRMHVRAYNHWVSLLRGRDFPSIEDLEPGEVEDFSGYSVLLDFTCGRDDPAIPYVGTAIRDECGLDDDMRTISDVPSRSLLSRLTDHYMQIIANRTPVGFEAEFENPAGATICYRGILMPFSSDGDAIDFIYGVINWKGVDGREQHDAPAADLPTVDFADPGPEIEESLGLQGDMVEPSPPAAEPIENAAAVEEPIEHDEPPVAPTSIPFSWEDGPSVDEDTFTAPEIVLDADAGLADRLWAARETAESVKSGEGRTRAALYKALSLAYDFAIAAEANPEDYAELLEESGVKAQARAPMTPIVKLVFGIDYDKARLTEFAAALSFAQRQELPAGEFQSFVEKQAGGLKALVAAERQARRPDTKPDTKSEAARAKLRAAPTISLADVPAEEEFAIVVTRRGTDGRHELVGLVDDPALVDRAIRRLA